MFRWIPSSGFPGQDEEVFSAEAVRRGSGAGRFLSTKLPLIMAKFIAQRVLCGFTFALFLAGVVQNQQAASVGASGYTNSFVALPVAADWSTYSIAGAGGDLGCGRRGQCGNSGSSDSDYVSGCYRRC